MRACAEAVGAGQRLRPCDHTVRVAAQRACRNARARALAAASASPPPSARARLAAGAPSSPPSASAVSVAACAEHAEACLCERVYRAASGPVRTAAPCGHRIRDGRGVRLSSTLAALRKHRLRSTAGATSAPSAPATPPPLEQACGKVTRTAHGAGGGGRRGRTASGAEKSSSSAAFWRASSTTSGGKRANSATWMPNDWSHAPSATCRGITRAIMYFLFLQKISTSQALPESRPRWDRRSARCASCARQPSATAALIRPRGGAASSQAAQPAAAPACGACLRSGGGARAGAPARSQRTRGVLVRQLGRG